MQGQCEAAKINISNAPIVHELLFQDTSPTKQHERNEKPSDARAPPVEERKKSNTAKASLPKVPIPRKKESEEEEEEVATHLGGDLLTSHFTMANLHSNEDN